MSSPYNAGQKYSPGFTGTKKTGSIGSVSWVTSIGFGSDGSDSAMRILPPKATPLSGAGKVRDDRKRQNQGFSL